MSFIFWIVLLEIHACYAQLFSKYKQGIIKSFATPNIKDIL